MIANQRNDDGSWDWRTFGTGEGFTADLIVTGFLSADRIQTHSITANHLASDVGQALDISSNQSVRIAVEEAMQQVEGSIVQADTPPEAPSEGLLWLDIGQSPPMLYRWSGTEWGPISDNADEIMGNVELQIAEAHAEIEATANSVRSEVAESYAPVSDLDKVEKQLTTLATQTSSNYTWTVSQISQLQADAADSAGQ